MLDRSTSDNLAIRNAAQFQPLQLSPSDRQRSEPAWSAEPLLKLANTGDKSAGRSNLSGSRAPPVALARGGPSASSISALTAYKHEAAAWR
jgi:hypothetical protein